MSSSDVRAILSLPQSSSASAGPSRRPPRTARKPDGITRELYALIGDNAPFLAEAQASIAAVKYRERPKLKGKKVKWEWTPFTPAARQDAPVRLNHWVRVTDENAPAAVEYFGKFNLQGPSIMEYSQYEYDQHLVDPDWSSHETVYLFDLLRQYDLRFVIVADRYDYRGPRGDSIVKRRTIEDIKERYYAICRRLIRTRTASDPQSQQHMLVALSFDKVRETKRKQYASELFHLTAAEIAEEEALFIEMKRLEQNERRYGTDRDDLLRTIVGLESGLVAFDERIDTILGVDKNKKRKRPEEEPVPSPNQQAEKKPKESTAQDAVRCIYRVPPSQTNPNASHVAMKHPPLVPAYLRSSKMPVPKSNSAIRTYALLSELGINTQRLVMPTRSIIEAYDGVLIAAGALVDIKRQVDRVEQDIRTLRAQREGFIPPPESRKIRSVSVASTDTTATRSRV